MGFTITLYTARYGDRESGNINRQYQRGYVEWIIYGYKRKTDSVDWIASALGNTFNEWADWDGHSIYKNGSQ